MAEAKGVEAVERALKILECFTPEVSDLSLAQLSEQTGFYKSTILRLAVSLEAFGYLTRDQDGKFRLGPTAWRLGATYQQGFDLSVLLRPELKSLSLETCETASFYIPEGEDRICLCREEPDRAIRHSVAEGARLPVGQGASGRILSAFQGSTDTVAEKVREAGYAVSLGERDSEVAAVSVPIFAASGRLAGALAVSGLITRFEPGRQKVLLGALIRSKQRLERRIPA